MGDLIQLPISCLKDHPRNKEFFDDITGEDWNNMIRSIQTSGIRVPLTVTQDYVVVSGHQRIRACRELGIKEVNVIIQNYDSEDEILKDLIEINIIQRGIGNPNPVKFGRCIMELERIYGIRSGSAGRVSLEANNYPPNASPHTEQEFAEVLGISLPSLKNYKKLAQLIPEVEDFLDTGMITQTTALAIARQLSADDQLEFISRLDATKKYTAREVQPYIDQLKSLRQKTSVPGDYKEVKEQAERYKREHADLTAKYNDLLSQQAKDKKEIAELRKSQYSEPAQAANAAYDFWKAADRFVKEVVSPFHYDEAMTEYKDALSGQYIIRACNLLIDSATDIVRRFKTDVVDVEIIDV